ncbi:unnamed protein product [Cuscuta epithymum]|uniref:BTB domain-containing protein n=1 Tax=Cuscuta epithymum TaxID=186058 RepID=A0AAV0G4D7_9ASTE|nr:unnamed protein product [Cuscuta epithymum]
MPAGDTAISNIVSIDVGGQLFQTTKHTLAQAGSKSLLLANAASSAVPLFIDRDPELFSVLLSLLRTGSLPSRAKALDVQDLIFESRFYGIEHLLTNSPSLLDPFNLQKSMLLPFCGRDSPASISTTPSGSLHVAHGSKVTSFDWALRSKSTMLTQFTAIDSLLALSPSVVAAGATDLSGLQILDVDQGSLTHTLQWENVTRSDSTVLAIASSHDYIFTTFESGRRNSSCVMVYDLNTFTPVAEIGHCEIFGADLDSAIPPTKLRWIPTHNLLMAAGSHSGPSGVSGNIKFWDLRSGNTAPVWEVKERADCFSDITVSPAGTLFKVGVHSGEVFFADFRNILSSDDNVWVCLGGADGWRTANNNNNKKKKKKEGVGCRIECHGNQVFRSKGGQIELWSEVLVGSGNGRGVFRKNTMSGSDSIITHMSFGGNKMFVTRKDQQCVEVWQNCVTRLF